MDLKEEKVVSTPLVVCPFISCGGDVGSHWCYFKWCSG